MNEAIYSVYVLENTTGRHYIGVTEDVLVRLVQHNAGISKWTRRRGPWQVVWTRGGLTLGEARQLENLLKRQRGGSGFYTVTGLSQLKPSGSLSRSRGIPGSNPGPATNSECTRPL